MQLHLLRLGEVITEILTVHQILPLPLLFHLMDFLVVILRNKVILLQSLVVVKVFLYTLLALQSLVLLLVQILHQLLMHWVKLTILHLIIQLQL